MNPKTCPTCHAPIPENAPGGLCPACVLRDAEEPAPAGRGAPPIGEIAAAFPQWEVLGLIGQGGMGFVYKIRQPALDRIVALKILSPELGRDPAFAERFAREARTLGKLHHPNIVTIFEHGEAGGFFYLLMEHVDGVNLRQAMRAGRFTPEQALAIVPPICDALQAAHAQGIWHRDIKPENILLDRDGRVKIADFGIARIVGDSPQNFTLTLTGNALGSAAYMAPEQHENPRGVDHRADIYSLGVVIYEMLTGELPLGRFPNPSQRAEVSARIDEIVLRTLEKERELRQQSADEVKTDVQAADQEPVAVPPMKWHDEPARLTLWSLALMIGGVAVFTAAAFFTFGQAQGVLLTLALVAFLLGWIGGCLANSAIRKGRISSAWHGRLRIGLWSPAVAIAAALVVGGVRILSYQNQPKSEASHEFPIVPTFDEYSTPEKAVKYQIKVAEERNQAAFECSVSTRLIAQISREGLDSREFMPEWADLTYSHQIFNNGKRAGVRLVNRNSGSEYNVPLVLLREATWQIDSLVPIDVTGSTVGEGIDRMNAAVMGSNPEDDWNIDQTSLAKPKQVDEGKDWAPLQEYIKDGDMRVGRGDLTGGLRSYRAAGELIEKTQRDHPEAALEVQAQCLTRIGDVQCMQGDLHDALESYRIGTDILIRLLEETPEDERLRNSLVQVHVKLGDIQQAAGDPAAATRSYRNAVAVAGKLKEDWETEHPIGSSGHKLARNYKAEDVLRLIDGTERDSWDLMWMIGQAGADKDDRLLPLLGRKDLREDATLALALAGYDYSLNGNRKGLDFILAELSKRTVGADANEVVVLFFVDEWDRTTKAINSHFLATDGAGGECMLSFWATRMLLFPRHYLEFRGLAGEGAPIGKGVPEVDAGHAPKPGDAMKTMLEAARNKNHGIFEDGFSKSFKAELADEDASIENFGDFAKTSFVTASTLDSTNAEVVVEAGDGSNRRFTFWMVLEDGAWKLNALGAKP